MPDYFLLPADLKPFASAPVIAGDDHVAAAQAHADAGSVRPGDWLAIDVNDVRIVRVLERTSFEAVPVLEGTAEPDDDR